MDCLTAPLRSGSDDETTEETAEGTAELEEAAGQVFKPDGWPANKNQ